jgi:hypothetical protein
MVAATEKICKSRPDDFCEPLPHAALPAVTTYVSKG